MLKELKRALLLEGEFVVGARRGENGRQGRRVLVRTGKSEEKVGG